VPKSSSAFVFRLCADQDSVRLLAVECCASLGKLLERQDCVTHVLPIIISFSQVSPTLMLNHLLAVVEAGLYCIMFVSLHFSHSVNQSTRELSRAKYVCILPFHHGLEYLFKSWQLTWCNPPFLQDKSWRVRYMVASQLYELADAVGPDLAR
jgi:hypothetical protein